jgi:protein MPE1
LRKNFRPKFPTAPPPPSYICFRCGQKGHYIANCPTNADPNFNRPKIRKTTGIPKTFLKPIDSSAEGDLGTLPPNNVLISADGNLVTLESNEELWSKVSGIHRMLSLNSDTVPEHFKCALCTKVLTDPVHFSCCPSVNFCDECKICVK